MKEGHIIQLMCISPQWNVPLKTFSHILCALLVILCIILPWNTVGMFQTLRCESGLFLHVNPETRTRVCCITVPLPKGYEYISCEENGTPDRIEKCPDGLYQADNTTTASEAKCTSEIECNPEENLKISDCDAEGHCVFTCICNYNKGHCGENFYDCQSFPADCPKKWVQKDCTCKWKPSLASSTLGSSTNTQKSITTPPGIPTGGTSKPIEKNDETTVGEDNNVPVNGMGDLPDQNLRGLQQHEIIILVVFVVGIPACIAGLAVYCRRSQRNRQYESVDYYDGSNINNGNHGDGGGGGCSENSNIPDSVVTIQPPEEVIDHSNGPNDSNSSHGGGGSSNSDTGNIPGYSHTGADNGAGYGDCNGSRKQSVAVVKPRLMGNEISSNEQDAVREMSMEGYSDFTWSILDNPTIPPDEETALKVVDNLQKQDDVTSEQQTSEEAHVEEQHQSATNNI